MCSECENIMSICCIYVYLNKVFHWATTIEKSFDFLVRVDHPNYVKVAPTIYIYFHRMQNEIEKPVFDLRHTAEPTESKP